MHCSRFLRTHIPSSRSSGARGTSSLVQQLSVYDACYVVLAEALDAPLVTADRRLAEATANAVLLT